MAEKTRNIGLDIMRVVAIMMVLIHHWVAINLNLYKSIAVYTVNFSLFGYYGVEIFFVLSGFLIGNIIIKMFVNNPGFDFGVVKTFWMRRWLRTLPLYYFILIIHILILVQRHEDLSFIWKYCFFIQNFFSYIISNNDFFGESWSLAIEEWFYLSFPVLLILFNLCLKRKFSKQKILVFTILFYLIVPTVTKFALVLFQQPSWNNVLRKAVICREDSIAYGLVGAYLFNFKPAILFARKNAKMVAGVLALAILGFIFCREVTTSYYNDSKGVSFFSGTFIFSCVSFSILLTLPFFYQYKMGNNVLRICITFVSKVSYSLYLIHLFMERLSHRFFPANSVFFISARFVFFFAASFIVSALSYKFIEEKFLIIRDRIWKEKYKPA